MIHSSDHEREPPVPVAEVEGPEELLLLVARVTGRLQQAGGVRPGEQRLADEERVCSRPWIVGDAAHRRADALDDRQQLQPEICLEPE